MADVDSLAKQIDDLIVAMERDEPGRHERLPSIQLTYAPRGHEDDGAKDGPVDPWIANWRMVYGTGQTCEMALLDLRSRIRRRVAEYLEREQQRVARANDRIEAARALLEGPGGAA